jgi:hypothetical protein
MQQNNQTENTEIQSLFLSVEEFENFHKWQQYKLNTGSKYEIILDGKSPTP